MSIFSLIKTTFKKLALFETEYIISESFNVEFISPWNIWFPPPKHFWINTAICHFQTVLNLQCGQIPCCHKTPIEQSLPFLIPVSSPKYYIKKNICSADFLRPVPQTERQVGLNDFFPLSASLSYDLTLPAWK